MKTLIAFTGGIDSTYLLWRTLSQTDDEITAFWMDCRTVANEMDLGHAHAAESLSTQAVVSWLRANVRDFEFRTLVPDEINPGEWITPTVIRLAGGLMQGEFDRFLTGRSMENTRAHLGHKTKDWYPAIFAQYASHGVMLHPLQDEVKSRAHAFAEMPADLLALAVSCNAPTAENGAVKPCGKCTKCRLSYETKALLSLGRTADQVCDFHMRKRGAGPYAGVVTPDPAYGSAVIPAQYVIPDEFIGE